MSKNMVETDELQMTSQYGAYALRVGLARLYARMRMHTPTRQGTHTHAPRARMHTHRPISRPNAYCFSTVTMIAKTPRCYVTPLFTNIQEQTPYVEKMSVRPSARDVMSATNGLSDFN